MPRCYWTISSNPNSHKRFSYVYDVCILNAQFKSPYGFYSVYDRMYSLCAVYKPQRFLFCLSPYLFSEWHIVPQLYVQIKQSRVYSRKALYECKASRRVMNCRRYWRCTEKADIQDGESWISAFEFIPNRALGLIVFWFFRSADVACPLANNSGLFWAKNKQQVLYKKGNKK